MTKIPSVQTLFSVKALGFCALLSFLTFCCKPLPAAMITGLCNTGESVSITGVCGGLLGPTAVDTSYALTNPLGGPSGHQSFVVVADNSQYKYPLGSWIPNGPASEWIGPAASQPYGGSCCASGDYVYTETFYVGGSTPVQISGQWASDNQATMSIDNGEVSLAGATSASFQSWTPFTLTADAGWDTLTFTVHNVNQATGLRVEYNAAPEPSTLAALGAGMVILGFVNRKRFGQQALN